MMCNRILLSLFLGVVTLCSVGQSAQRISRDQYLNSYKSLAISEMKRTGIPASITLAQGCLESDYGNSDLAREANNHFGIKCHKEWAGKKFFKDDDAKNECFRVYKKAEESYADHSEFLKTRDRYAFLFELDVTDYKSWAKGLKKAGYATNPRYPELLIKIIEDNNLHEYDRGAIIASSAKPSKHHKFDAKTLLAPPRLADLDADYEVASPVRQEFSNNKVSYIITRNKDTYESIAKEYNISKWQLLRYNDLRRDSTIRPRQLLYIEPKKTKAEKKFPAHVVQEGETLYKISQLYGVKLKRLAKRNAMTVGDMPEAGSQLLLR